MWSLVQYRRLQKQAVAQSESNKNTKRGGKDDLADSAPTSSQDVEKSDRSSKPQKSNTNGKIYIKATGDNDPLDPHNWPLLERSKNIAILAYLIFVQAWAGAAESMANSKASSEQGHSQIAENLTVAMYLFGIGTGSVLAGPVSETVGRNPTYLVGTFCYLCLVVGAALAPNFGGRMVCRYLMGFFVSATLSINGSSVKDQFRPVKRAFVFPAIAWTNVAAPMIAPVASGWTVQNLGWRWTEWITLIISAPAFLLALLFLPETSFPILLKWKAAGLRCATRDDRYVSEHTEASFKERMEKGIKMPTKLFFTEPVVTVLGVYLSLLWVLQFTFLSGFEYIFKKTYGLSTAMTGSCFGAIASGATAFTLLAPGMYSWARHKTEHIRGANVDPEFRLWPAIVAGPLLPVSLFWLGWCNYSNISIWCSLAACFVLGAVMIAIYVSSYEYLIDSYGENSPSALSAITFPRYMIAGGMVMASRQMYSGIGVHWTMTLLGCIAAILAPAPLIFWKLGPKVRNNSPYAERQGGEE